MIMYKAFFIINDNLTSCNDVIVTRNKVVKNVGGNLKTWIKDQFTSYSTPDAALDELYYKYLLLKNKDIDIIVTKVELTGNITHEHNGCRKCSKIKVLEDINIEHCITQSLSLEMRKYIVYKYPHLRDKVKDTITRSDWVSWCKDNIEDKDYFFNKFDFNNNNSLTQIIMWYRAFPEYKERIKEKLINTNNFIINGIEVDTK